MLNTRIYQKGHFALFVEDGELYSQTQRVHALNVLRALYRNSSLGDAVQPFISQGLKAAVTGYKSQV